MRGVAFTGYKGQNAPIKIPVPCAGQTGTKQPEVGDGWPPPPRIRGRFLPESQHCPISRGIPLESGATSCEDEFDANALPPFTEASTSHVLRLVGALRTPAAGASDGEVFSTPARLSRLRGRGRGPRLLSRCPQTPPKTPIRALLGPGHFPFSMWIFQRRLWVVELALSRTRPRPRHGESSRSHVPSAFT